jgi:hypothetical protein
MNASMDGGMNTACHVSWRGDGKMPLRFSGLEKGRGGERRERGASGGWREAGSCVTDLTCRTTEGRWTYCTLHSALHWIKLQYWVC